VIGGPLAIDGLAVKTKAMAITNTLNRNKSAASSLTQGGAMGWLLLTSGSEQTKRKAIFSVC
jgi:ATP-dependent protease ClpP protease subunit